MASQTKKLVIVKGKGTANEVRIVTDIDMYLDNRTGRWVTIPEDYE